MTIDFVKYVGSNTKMTKPELTQFWLDFAQAHGYRTELLNPKDGYPEKNPETPEQFSNRIISDFVTGSVKSARTRKLQEEIKVDVTLE